jgi:hypothetical protein
MSFPGITDTELAAMRADIAAVAVTGSTVKVLTPVAGDDDAEGRSTLTWPDPDTVATVPARLWLKDARELRGEAWVQVQSWKARVALDVDVTIGSRIVDTATGTVFEVATHHTVATALGALYQELTLTAVDGGVL